MITLIPISILTDKIKRALFRFHQIKAETGIGYFRILVDFITLNRKINISFTEYFNFQFEKQHENFRNTFLSSKNKKKYLSILNPRKYYILARNKYLTHLYLENHNIRKADLFCYYNPNNRSHHRTVAYDYNSVLEILKTKNVEQCILKPVESSHGDGVWLINKVEYTKNECRLHRFDGAIIGLSELLSKEPLIFESYIEQTEQFKRFNPSSVNTIRFITTLYPGGDARLIAAFLKIGKGGACIDNAGSGGNIMAEVDPYTGQILAVTQFDGWRKTKPITHHFDTGELLEGVTINNWNDIKETVLQYQQSNPFLKAIGWDIAITDNGPVVIEINDEWDSTGQLINKQGWKKDIKECYDQWVKYSNSIT